MIFGRMTVATAFSGTLLKRLIIEKGFGKVFNIRMKTKKGILNLVYET